jgi:hypothetical protein
MQAGLVFFPVFLGGTEQQSYRHFSISSLNSPSQNFR